MATNDGGPIVTETYRGEVRNGVVVFEGPAPPEGTKVSIAAEMPAQGRTLADRLRGVIGKAKGLPPDMAEQHDHYLHGLPKR